MIVPGCEHEFFPKLGGLAAWEPAYRIPEEEGVFLLRARFSPDGRLIAAGTVLGEVKVWDVETGHLLRKENAHGRGINDLCWDGSGDCTVSAASDSSVSIFSHKEKRPIVTLTSTHKGACMGVQVPPEWGSTWLLTAGYDQDVKRWELRTRSAVRCVRAHTAPITTLDLTPDAAHFLSGGYDGALRVFDSDTMRPLKTLAPVGDEEARPPVQHAEFAPGSPQVVWSLYADRCVRVWAVKRRQPDMLFRLRPDPWVKLRSGCPIYKKDGRQEEEPDETPCPHPPFLCWWNGRPLTLSDDGNLLEWNLRTGECATLFTDIHDTSEQPTGRDPTGKVPLTSVDTPKRKPLPLLCTAGGSFGSSVIVWTRQEGAVEEEEGVDEGREKSEEATAEEREGGPLGRASGPFGVDEEEIMQPPECSDVEMEPS
uniref:Uncharacterized protein n=1 Tax=Chromera velia CCMP2878 TaxID=1169474 RepID=A0A0G4GWT9_9ALVE|mmetsp:Transcript_36936/g.72633  ORF Transcript_36936/g.72633 Transcript_36936/m.72633 type:complete len:425 (-) Transcript_36936:280-1554(-)|eukprot:Cvel_5308.t1-p1 / transcript=Cvel_5308.t1 / gene=Cvel_5308 / organism=Chromera_velia_CCMP2878 / gene_product=WD repeat-containing protein 5 homolog, putative / transcript_product=WD repeat-containing protein 5 homolog, putative / location=Cvel_scaffold246:21572-24525(+) / protein_length=424 / sequence_SO=supercontig / SO=protein_coding / is_pseudo=false